jgi:hypothetical protein
MFDLELKKEILMQNDDNPISNQAPDEDEEGGGEYEDSENPNGEDEYDEYEDGGGDEIV